MKFTLRDLFWLTVVVALLLALWRQSATLSGSNFRVDAVRRHAEALRRELSQAENNEQVYIGKLAEVYGLDTGGLEAGEIIEVDWELAARMIP